MQVNQVIFIPFIVMIEISGQHQFLSPGFQTRQWCSGERGVRGAYLPDLQHLIILWALDFQHPLFRVVR